MKDKSEKESVLKDAASLWQALSAPAQMHKICYDKELLLGSEANRGLYFHLGIVEPGSDFLADLAKHAISVEKLLVAFFKTLQPYAQMMSDLCVFFEKNEIKETNQYLRIKFDFEAEDLQDTEFNLDHFREQLERYSTAQEMGNFLYVTDNAVFQILRILSEDYEHASDAEWIKKWEADFNAGNWYLPDLPFTNHENLDIQLSKVYELYKSFTVAALERGMTQRNAPQFFNYGRDQKEEGEKYTAGWADHVLATATHDRWPVSFLKRLFYRLELLASFSEELSEEEAESWALEIQAFFDKYGIYAQNEKDIVQELQDLLKLPIWQKRHELYSVWILALMDKVISKFPNYRIHHADGQLIIKFKATKLASFDTEIGMVELWTEVRMPLDNPTGHGRKANIQPDYTFFKDVKDFPQALSGLVVVEVKQYEKPNKSNFTAVLEDYPKGVENAHVFLVNYGRIRPDMAVTKPERCSPIGQVYPGTTAAKAFQQKLSDKLPKPLLPDLLVTQKISTEEWLHIRDGYLDIYVDISHSLDLESYKQFLKTFLTWAISGNSTAQLIAIDNGLRKRWEFPQEQDIDDLLSLSFDYGTDFRNEIQNGNALVITDEDGLRLLKNSSLNQIDVICYTDGKPIKYIKSFLS